MTEEFEEWAKSEGYEIARVGFEYWCGETKAAYAGWEEGRAALKREQAEKAATAIHEAMEPKKVD